MPCLQVQGCDVADQRSPCGLHTGHGSLHTAGNGTDAAVKPGAAVFEVKVRVSNQYTW